MSRRRTVMKSKKRYPAVHLILVLFGIIMVFPFIWMILSSFKSVGEQMTLPVKIFPSNFKNIDNYRQALQAVPFIKLYLNTFLMIAGRCICAVLFSSMAGYGFARFQFPGKNLLFTLVLVQMMVPGQVFIIPQYQMLSNGICTDLSGSGQCLRCISAASAIYVIAKRVGRGGCAGWLQSMANVYKSYVSDHTFQYFSTGCIYSAVCVEGSDVAVNRK